MALFVQKNVPIAAVVVLAPMLATIVMNPQTAQATTGAEEFTPPQLGCVRATINSDDNAKCGTHVPKGEFPTTTGNPPEVP